MHARYPRPLIHKVKAALSGCQPGHHLAKCKESRHARAASSRGAAQERLIARALALPGSAQGPGPLKAARKAVPCANAHQTGENNAGLTMPGCYIGWPRPGAVAAGVVPPRSFFWRTRMKPLEYGRLGLSCLTAGPLH